MQLQQRACRRYSRRDWSAARLPPRLRGAIEPRPWAGQLARGHDNLAKQYRGRCQVKQLQREIGRGLTFGYPDNLCRGYNPSWCPKRKLDKAVGRTPIAYPVVRRILAATRS